MNLVEVLVDKCDIRYIIAIQTWRYKKYMYKSFTQIYFIFLLAIGELMFLVETKPYAVLECKNTQRKCLADIY